MIHSNITRHPDRLSSYFKDEAATLAKVTVTGIVYNVGLLAEPWFEGKLAGCLFDIFGKNKNFYDMLRLVIAYVVVISVVQAARYLKRLYVRRFANHINRDMKRILYGNLVHHSRAEFERESVGSVITKAISDVDACAEGMRKFTTEVFDTGVLLIGYAVFLIVYDWRLALVSLLAQPVSYLIAEKMKTVVQKSGAAAQESRSRLNAATLDRVSNATTYRAFGCEPQRNLAYENNLSDYEKNAVLANIWVAVLPPIYHGISMVSVIFILYFGGRNVTGNGCNNWDIAAFTTFISCFAKLAVKSSKAAKLFNAVQKADVSWKRIKPLMQPVKEEKAASFVSPATLEVSNLSVAYSEDKPIFGGLDFTATLGQIIGVTGPVACGKSTFGRAFLCEHSYKGSIRFGGKELSALPEDMRCGIVGYLGHDTELFGDTVRNNIFLGDAGDVDALLEAVCLKKEVDDMPDGADTIIGSNGIRLSGGQQSRLALARTLAHKRPLYVLDDPFSALDANTEMEIYDNLRSMTRDSIVILISHRLYLFPRMDKVIWMENGETVVASHSELMERCEDYANLYGLQAGDKAGGEGR